SPPASQETVDATPPSVPVVPTSQDPADLAKTCQEENVDQAMASCAALEKQSPTDAQKETIAKVKDKFLSKHYTSAKKSLSLNTGRGAFLAEQEYKLLTKYFDRTNPKLWEIARGVQSLREKLHAEGKETPSEDPKEDPKETPKEEKPTAKDVSE